MVKKLKYDKRICVSFNGWGGGRVARFQLCIDQTAAILMRVNPGHSATGANA
jgi:hypothetical protein